jgi:hypothetical protein
MTVLLFVSHVGTTLSDAVINESILPLAISLAQDPVANIRFAAASSLESLFPRLSKVCLAILKQEFEKGASCYFLKVESNLCLGNKR